MERVGAFDWQDRTVRRPAFAAAAAQRHLSPRPLTLELGKQFIRWGKADILNPTDRFAPRDFLNVPTTDFLP